MQIPPSLPKSGSTQSSIGIYGQVTDDVTVLWQTITKTAAANMTNNNNQDPDNIGQGFVPTSINRGDNGLFIPSLTMDPCIISGHHQIDHIKQSLGTHLNIYHKTLIYYCQNFIITPLYITVAFYQKLLL